MHFFMTSLLGFCGNFPCSAVGEPLLDIDIRTSPFQLIFSWSAERESQSEWNQYDMVYTIHSPKGYSRHYARYMQRSSKLTLTMLEPGTAVLLAVRKIHENGRGPWTFTMHSTGKSF